MEIELTEDEERKTVVDQDGQELGTVTDVDYSALQVEPSGDALENRENARELEDSLYEIQEKYVTEVRGQEIEVDLDQ